MITKIFSREYLDLLANEARKSPRLRRHKNIHQDYSDPCQRLFNSICEDSYIRPHRHSVDPKAETLIAIQGKFILVTFDEFGIIESKIKFGTEKYSQNENLAVGVEVSPKVWHTIIALDSHSILLEVKSGPFIENAAKELATWAPEEGTVEGENYLSQLKNAIF